MPTNGSVGTLTFSPRYIGQVEDAARARAVRPPPLPRAVRAVPVALPAARIAEREHRHVPRLRRLLAVVRARQPGDARLRLPAPRPDRGQRRGPSLHRPLLPGRLQGHPQRRRRRPVRATPSPSRAGRTARRTSCSSAGTSRARACSTCSRPTGSCARWATTTGSWSWARAAGARGAPIRRDARPPGGRVPRPRVRGREGAALPDGRRLRLAGDRRRIVRHRAARGDGRRRPDRGLDIHGYKGVVRRGREGLLVPPHDPASCRPRSAGCSTTRGCGPR